MATTEPTNAEILAEIRALAATVEQLYDSLRDAKQTLYEMQSAIAQTNKNATSAKVHSARIAEALSDSRP